MNLLEYVEPHSIDSIVSSIPLSNISIAEKKELLLQCKEALKPTGTLIQYQYSLADYKLLKAIFGQVELQFALLNIPPAFIYICRD